MPKKFFAFGQIYNWVKVFLAVVGLSVLMMDHTDQVQAVYCAPLKQNITCPNGDHPGGSTPNLGNLFTIDRVTLRAAIQCCGKQVSFDRLNVKEEKQSVNRYPGFHVHWDYDTNSSASCYTKNFNIHMYDGDCPGAGIVGECPKDSSGNRYLSGIDYFEYLCQDSCALYESMTGLKCSDIMDQTTEEIVVTENNTHQDGYVDAADRSYNKSNAADSENIPHPIKFALGDPDKRALLQGAIDGLNDLLPYAGVSHCGLGKVSSLNLGRIDSQIDLLYDRTGDLKCLEAEKCWAKKNAAYNAARRDYYKSVMDYSCDAFKNYNDSSRYTEQWQSTYSNSFQRTATVYTDGQNHTQTVTISTSCSCYSNGNYPNTLAACKSTCYSKFINAKNSAENSRRSWERSLTNSRNWLNNNGGSYSGCVSQKNSQVSQAQTAYNTATNTRNACRSGCSGTYGACSSSCNATYSTCYVNCRDSTCRSNCYSAYSNCISSCSSSQSTCNNNCDSPWNAASTALTNAQNARNRCDTENNNLINNSYRPAYYQARADAYQAHADESQKDQYYKHRYYYRDGYYYGSYGRINCANNHYVDGENFTATVRPYVSSWYQYPTFKSPEVLAKAKAVVTSKGLNDCKNAIAALPKHVQRYKYSREWGCVAGDGLNSCTQNFSGGYRTIDFNGMKLPIYNTNTNEQNQYYCGSSNSVVCNSSTKNSGCHTNPSMYDGLKEKEGDTDPKVLVYDTNTIYRRCYKKSNLHQDDDVDWMKSHISLPGFIADYIDQQVALIKKRKEDYWKTIAELDGGPDTTNAWHNSWRKKVNCPDAFGIYTRDCVAVNLLEGCRKQANKIMQTESNNNSSVVTHKSEGLLTTYQDNHACTGDNDAVSAARCYRSSCYQQKEYCRNINQFFVEHDEPCSVGPNHDRFGNEVYAKGKNGTRLCRNCAVPSSCAQANVMGFRFDALSSCTDGSGGCSNIEFGYLIDNKNMARFRTVIGNCTNANTQDCKNLYYMGTRVGYCNVGAKDSALCEAHNMKPWSDTACSGYTNGRNTPVAGYIYERNSNDEIIGETKCWTGECVDTCIASGYFTLATSNCSSHYACLDGSSTCQSSDTLNAHKVRPVAGGRTYPDNACYDAHCRAPQPSVPVNTDICVAHGYAAKVGSGFSCGANEEFIKNAAGRNYDTITYYTVNSTTGAAVANTANCYLGCKLKDTIPSQECTSDKPLAKNTIASGTLVYVNNREMRYKSLSAYRISVGEKKWYYKDAENHDSTRSTSSWRSTHYYLVAAQNGKFTKATTTTAKVCRFDQCVPNDAKIVADGMNEIYANSKCKSMDPATSTSVRKIEGNTIYIPEVGALYDDCDNVYSYKRCTTNTVHACLPRCRIDTDKGYGTYQSNCWDRQGNATTKDTCPDQGYSTTSTYHSEIACGVPTCASGWTLSINKNDTLNPDDKGGTTNKAKCNQTYYLDCNHTAYLTSTTSSARTRKTVCYGKGGTIQCATGAPNPQPNPNRTGCHTGDTSCYKINGCDQEYNAANALKAISAHPTEFGQPNEAGLNVCNHSSDKRCNAQDEYIFIPAGRSDTREAYLADYGTSNVNYKAGFNGLRCGRYMHVSKPSWTTANSDTAGNSGDSSYVADASGQSNANRCPGASVNLSSGSFSVSGDLELNYNYFKNLIDIDKLKVCGSISDAFKDDSGFYLCKVTSTTIKSSQLRDWGWLDAGRNVIIFFDSSDANATFTIDTNIVTDQDHFKAFIARKKISVDGNVGKFPKLAMDDHDGCSSMLGADLQGFFAAEVIVFEHAPVNGSLGAGASQTSSRVAINAELEPFNDVSQLYCDRQLVIAGNLIQWGSQALNLNRTFKGCVGGKATTDGESSEDWNAVLANPAIYPDYNAFLSPVVFYQRADFNNSAPSWMKTTNVERIETN
ncbi:hypothetical protein IJJ08_04775 [bacterium]|nr:hypothetical protein [bacterium]